MPPLAECDFCQCQFLTHLRHVVVQPRPTDPYEAVAVMWACPTCGPAYHLPTAAEVHAHIERGDAIDGEHYTRASV